MSAMTKEEAKKIKVGDRLKVNPYWNETTKTRKLPAEITVKNIRRNQQSQTRVLVKCETKTEVFWLDAAWFERAEECPAKNP